MAPADVPLAVLVVGYGPRGREWDRACRRDGRFAVVGAVDPAPAAQAAARAAGLAVWDDLATALAAVRPGAAIVATPPRTHADDACASAEAGAAVLVEKPLALTVRSAARVARSASRVVVGQNFRYLARERAIRRALARVGPVIRGTVESARVAAAAPAHLAAVEHGPLWDFAVHHLDVLRTRLGLPESVRAEATASRGATTYVLELQLPGGVHVGYRHVEGAQHGHYHEWLDAEGGTITVDGRWVVLRRPGARGRPVFAGRGPAPDERVLDALAAAAAGERTPLDATENLGTVALVEAAVRSLEAGGEVRVADALAAATGEAVHA